MMFTRRAEVFDSLVEGTSTAGGDDPRYAEFLALVATLRDVPAPEARPDFVADLRGRLVTAADTLLVPADEARLTLPARRPVRERRIAAAVAGVAVVGASASMAIASQSALPGDTLYPLKRAIENVDAGLSADQAQKGETLLASAEGRLQEVRELSTAGQPQDGAAIGDTLNAFTEQATEASDLLLADYAETGDEQSVSDLRGFTATSMEALTELEPVVPTEARDELLHAAQVLAQIDAEAERACTGCAGGITEIPAILAAAGYTADGSDSLTQALLPAVDTSAGDAREPKQRGDAGRQQPPSETGQAPVDPESVPQLPGQTGGGSGTQQQSQDGSDPVKDLTDGLLGQGGGSQPTQPTTSGDQPQLPDLGEVLTGVTEGVTDGLTGPLLNP